MPKNLLIDGTLYLYGDVGDPWGMGEGFTPDDVVDALAAHGPGDLAVRINSGGGIAFHGMAINALLATHDGNVTVHVDGIAASAASLIAMAGDTIEMRTGAMLMIHDPSGITFGNADVHKQTADRLDRIAENFAAVYAARSGLPVDEVRALMKAETWLGADEAIERGFATRRSDEPSADKAAFDYRIYARAPKGLPLRMRQRETAAVAAIQGEHTMPKAADQAAPGAVDQAATVAAASTAATTEMSAEPRAKPWAAGFYASAESSGLALADLNAIVAKAETHDAAKDLLIASMAATRNAGKPSANGNHVDVLRDERDTQRVGMEAALVAQLSMTAPTDERARAYMDMSLVDMAAACIGHRGSRRTVADRERILMAGTHTTSDFPHILENALNKMLLARYRDATPTYRRISRRVSFADFRPHPMTRAGDFPAMKEIAESGEIQYGTFGESREVVAVKSYAIAVRLSRQMLVNDELGAIAQVIADQGRSVARFEDKTFYTMVLSGSNADGPTLAETSRQVFNTTDLSKSSAATIIDVANLAAGRASLRKRQSIDGSPLNIDASILLVGPDRETQGQQIVAPIQAAQAGNVNPFSGTLSIVVTPHIATYAWYLFADPADVPCFIHGFLSGYEAPRMRTDEPFGQQGMAFSLEHDFGVGAIDHRGGYKNTGHATAAS